MTKCMECGELAHLVALDPREPPLDLGKCLCRECGVGAYNERIEELESELGDLKQNLDGLTE